MTLKTDFYDQEFNVSRNSQLYYTLVKLVKSVKPAQIVALGEMRKQLAANVELLKHNSETVSRAASNFVREQRFSSRRKNKHSEMEAGDGPEGFDVNQTNFVLLLAEVLQHAYRTTDSVYKFTKKLFPPQVMTDEENEKSFQGKLVEIQLNGAVLEDYAKNLTVLSYNTDMPRLVGKMLYELCESYYKMLLHRHTVEGQKYFKDPVITDVAMNVFENIDSQGEVKGLRKRGFILKNYENQYIIGMAYGIETSSQVSFVNRFTTLLGKTISEEILEEILEYEQR